MKFGPVPVDQAEGLILAHTFRKGGVVIKKGTTLSAGNLETLKNEGVLEVVGARLEPGDVHEDDAAKRIAEKLYGTGLKISAAHTGRCNLIAETDGVVQVNAANIDAINQVNETVTVATLPNMHAVSSGQTAATVKIIPFAADAQVMRHVEAKLKDPVVSIAPYRPKKYGLISTITSGLKHSVIETTERATRQRIEAVNGTAAHSVQVNHTIDDVAAEVAKARDANIDVLLIVGASATVDRGDIIPAALLQAGGVIDHFGMPVDPGNLIVLGDISGIPVLILPGCARSPKLNGIDWVMQRIAADIPVGHAEVMGMGVGGLLVDTPVRPLPRESAVEEKSDFKAPKIAALVLAAGQSQRMQGENKLLKTINGIPLVRRTVESILESDIDEVVVVLGHQAEEIREALDNLDVSFVDNPRFPEGLSTSLSAGLKAVDADAAVICLADMPSISADHINLLISGFNPEAGQSIGVPSHNGKRGNPVLWARQFFDEMCQISGDVGARHLIGANESLVYEVEFGDTGVLTDLDTPEEWSAFTEPKS